MADKAYVPPASYNSKNNTPIQQIKEYQATWCEWAAKNRQQIIIQAGSNVNGTYTLYSVPANKILFVTSAFVNAVGADSSGNFIRLFGSTGGTNLILQAQAGSNSLSFPMPLKVMNGSVLQYNVTAGHTSVGITGFLEDF